VYFTVTVKHFKFSKIPWSVYDIPDYCAHQSQKRVPSRALKEGVKHEIEFTEEKVLKFQDSLCIMPESIRMTELRWLKVVSNTFQNVYFIVSLLPLVIN